MSKPTLIPFKDTGFAVITGWGVGSAITSVTNASPAVVSRTAHGLADGDVVKHTGIVGMEDLNDVICVVEVISADTYSLIDIDATNWEAYVSGGLVSVATFSASCQVTGYQGPTGTTPSSTLETNCGSAKSYGDPQDGSASLSFAEASHAFNKALKAARATRSKIALKTTLPLGRGRLYDIGTVVSYDSNAQVNGNWTGGVVIERDQARIDLEG